MRKRHKIYKHKIKKILREKEIVETYTVKSDYVDARIEILKEGENASGYKLVMPEISPVTKALLEEVRHDLITEVAISAIEMLDPKVFTCLKQKFNDRAIKVLDEKVPGIKEATKKFLIGRLMQEMLGLDKLEFLLNDVNLEEIVIVTSGEYVRVYHKKYGWMETNVKVKSEEEILNYSSIIARRVGRQITTLNPLLDAHLVTGDRANAVLFPISTKGNTLTIRKFRRDPWTVTDLIENNSCSSDIFALLWMAIEYELNVLFSGGTASGKTTFLNVCMPFIPPNHRIISIEDTRELMLPEYLYWAPLATRQPNPEGKGEISMLDLLVNSLRMRPDRIILGEMRRQKEAEVLFEAMHTGHSVYATVHADTAAETISRLVNPPLNVPANLLQAVNLNVVLFRDRRKGIRRVSQVAEFIVEEGNARANIIYRLKPISDKIVPHSPSARFFEDISRHTGMSQSEIYKDLGQRKKILLWMLKNNIRSIEEVGRVLYDYYINREKLLELVDKNKKPLFEK